MFIRVFYFSNNYDFGVNNFETEKEYQEWFEETTGTSTTLRAFKIEYIKNTEIGILARHMNQCCGYSFSCQMRNHELINCMVHYINIYHFPEIIIPRKGEKSKELLLKEKENFVNCTTEILEIEKDVEVKAKMLETRKNMLAEMEFEIKHARF